MKFAQIFEIHGAYAAKNPFIMIVIALTIAAISNLGLMNIVIENSPETLWVSPTGIASQNEKYFNDKYGAYYRVNQFIFHPADSTSQDDVFQKHYLRQLYYIEKAIEEGTVEFEGSNYTVHDLCYQPIPGKGCMIQSPMEYWHMNLSLMEESDDIKQTATCVESTFPEEIACMTRSQIPVLKNVIMGAPGCADGAVESPCTVCRPTAEALLVTILLNKNQFTEAIALEWEKEVFQRKIEDFKAGTLQVPGMNASEITFFNNLTVSYMAERSISDELNNQTKSNALVVVISYSLMFFYIAIAMGSFPNAVHSGFILAVGGITIVIVSVTSSLGFLSYFGVGISMISAEVVPFLILAIGVDNMFIISDAYSRVRGNSIEEKVSHAMYESGPSITAAAFCEFLAFIVGASTNIPALQGFCLNAAIAVIFNYIYQITAFVAFLTLNEKRKDSERADCLFCVVVKDPRPPRPSVVYNLMNKYYVPFLFTKPCQVITMIIFFGLIALGFVGYNKLELGLEQQTSVTEGSPIFTYFGDLAHYLAAGPQGFIVFKNVDWQNKSQLAVIDDMVDEVSRYNQSILPPVYTWVNSFQQLLTDRTKALDCGASNWDRFTYDQKIREFVKIGIDSKCCKKYSICGVQYQQDMSFDFEGKLISSRFRFNHGPTNTQDDFINAYIGTTAIVDKWAKKLPGQASAFVYSLFYVYFEQYTYIKGVAFQNLMLACGAVFAAVVALKNSYSALFVFICTFFSAFDMMGLLWVLNKIVGGYEVQINAVSVVNFITTAGLSVEFAIHIMLKYTQYKGTRQERAKQALSVVGSSVVVGITITKTLGVSVLAFAPSTIFRLYYFRMYICLIVLGSFHGLVFLPIVLSWFGPNSVSTERSYSFNRHELNLNEDFSVEKDANKSKNEYVGLAHSIDSENKMSDSNDFYNAKKVE